MLIRLFAPVFLVLALAACGGESTEPTAVHTAANGDVYNDADVAFATAMVRSHADAIGLVVAADGRPLDDEARALADRIRDTHVVDAEQMVTWLTDWDRDIPETSLDHVNAGHGDEHASGHVAELAELGDEDFRDRWLELMTDQQEAAVALARAQQADGTHAAAVALAEAIEETQSADIATMEALLAP